MPMLVGPLQADMRLSAGVSGRRARMGALHETRNGSVRVVRSSAEP
jgi:hypothetical protein